MNTTRFALSAVLATTLAAAAALPALGAAAVGSAAPDFKLPAAAGASGDVGLRETAAKGKGAVVIFVSTRCPYSNAYNARMSALAKEYSAKGIAVLGVNSNTNEAVSEIADHAKKHSLAFPILKDGANKVADAYGANHTPEAYVIDAKGTLVYHGRIDESQEESGAKSHDLKNAIDAVLAGKPVPAAETKAFGCSIKRA